MSSRDTDWNYMGELAVQRRQLKVELKAYRLRVAREHLAAGYDSNAIAARLRVSRDMARELIAEVRGGRS